MPNLSTTTSTESRALELLGSGIGPETVAAALGVSVSRISQLLSEPEFAASVAELRFANLAKHNTRDASYDSLEDSLVEKLRDCLPLMMRPMEILKAIQVINAAKRRGQSTPDSILQTSQVVKLTIPSVILNQFAITTNVNNQVVQAGEQNLVTMQSSTLLDKLGKDKTQASASKGDTGNVQTAPATTKLLA